MEIAGKIREATSRFVEIAQKSLTVSMMRKMRAEQEVAAIPLEVAQIQIKYAFIKRRGISGCKID